MCVSVVTRLVWRLDLAIATDVLCAAERAAASGRRGAIGVVTAEVASVAILAGARCRADRGFATAVFGAATRVTFDTGGTCAMDVPNIAANLVRDMDTVAIIERDRSEEPAFGVHDFRSSR